MTFKESEHVNVIERLAELSGSGAPMDEMLAETWKLDRRIPLYPGITIMCLNAVLEKTETAGIVPGERIAATKGSLKIIGAVKTVNGCELQLRDVTIMEKKPDYILENADKIEKINEKTLEKVWPALVFKG